MLDSIFYAEVFYAHFIFEHLALNILLVISILYHLI